MISANMATRIGVAMVAIPATFFIIYLGGWVLAALISLFAVLGTLEFVGLARARGNEPGVVPAAIGAAAMPVAVFLMVAGKIGPSTVLLVAPAWLISLTLMAVRSGPERAPLAAVGIGVFAPLYTGGLLSAIIVLRQVPVSSSAAAATWLVFLPLVLTWVCDSLAMSVGGWVGGKKLAPVISPNKTWSGAVAGAVGAMVVAPLYDLLVLDRFGFELALPMLLVLGVVVGALGQVGDLAESLFKREAGIKDSGTFFPGHGGVLDRLDSLYWVLPSTVIVFRVFGVI